LNLDFNFSWQVDVTGFTPASIGSNKNATKTLESPYGM